MHNLAETMGIGVAWIPFQLISFISFLLAVKLF